MEEQEKEQKIIDQIKLVFDPEIPVNVYDLGLVYNCEINLKNEVAITMTLTSPSCAMAEVIVDDVKKEVMKLDFVTTVNIELTWNPPWEKSMMSETALFELGFL